MSSTSIAGDRPSYADVAAVFHFAARCAFRNAAEKLSYTIQIQCVDGFYVSETVDKKTSR
jgi:hypothetical protein